MERNERTKDRNIAGALVWTAVALIGTAALTYFVTRRLMAGTAVLDTDALLDAADKAANNLDAILRIENQVAS